ncbi:zinc-dependent metalloprotease [Altibacter sp. HG106]|uniref:zinc-dependent metalloprotease n=1 Tax=Altibacter sp. HG106 TaxID=3023937 RepID=UPI002350DC23|nr:zinc-dependent metalloprotease [Altibacter sp. HG106]MDC7993683.1 zinc-dependent metalloprotease [Altibacter sp. HG106]
MKHVILSCCALLCVAVASAQFLSDKSDVQKFEGFFDFYYSEEEGSIYLAVDKLDTEFLYVHSLRTGLGSNDIGLDRGQLGGGEVVSFVKSGNKILLVQPNMKYRATSENDLERRSISEAFARSVWFGFPIKETEGDTYLIDLTPFLMEDAHQVANRLKRGKEGTYKVDTSRSALWMERTKAFPKNVEFEALLTLKGTPTGSNLRSVAPNAESISVIQHHSFVELPDEGYTPRAFDPRSGSFAISYLDYSTPIWEPIQKRFITRHRLEKKNPTASVSEAVAPIIYYLDPGTPEPVRSALLEGARWWNQAFEAIGYKDAFQVKMLPGDADPMDVRYNVIQWVHRSTRGWSYGASITDPRTGEIIKGHVSLGSLRIRQDYMIAQALMNKPFATSDENYKPMLDLALARIRQLSAHEVGHTLGFAHNFAASTIDRASVMDYPHPKIDMGANGSLKFNDAYDTGIGDWDKVTVAYSYSDIPTGTDEKTYLNALLEGAFADGHRFITDSDARPQGGAHAKAHLWDNGETAAQELEKVLQLRKNAMQTFSLDNIRTGEPYTVLEDVFVPLYFFHRYQTEAAVKSIGGMEYDYLVKGYNGKTPSYLSEEKQANALAQVIKTLRVEQLAIPKQLQTYFPPRAYGYSRSRESFKSDMGVAFDPLGAAATASDMTLQLLLHPQRLNRLVVQKGLTEGEKNLGVEDVLSALTALYYDVPKDAYHKEVYHTIQHRILFHVLHSIQHKDVIPQAKAHLQHHLSLWEKAMEKSNTVNDRQMLLTIAQFRKFPEKFTPPPVPKIPDGSPIGGGCMQYH